MSETRLSTSSAGCHHAPCDDGRHDGPTGVRGPHAHGSRMGRTKMFPSPSPYSRISFNRRRSMSSAPEQSEAYRPKYNSAKKWALPPDIIEDILTLALPSMQLRITILLHDSRRIVELLAVCTERNLALEKLEHLVWRQRANEKKILHLLGLRHAQRR